MHQLSRGCTAADLRRSTLTAFLAVFLGAFLAAATLAGCTHSSSARSRAGSLSGDSSAVAAGSASATTTASVGAPVLGGPTSDATVASSSTSSPASSRLCAGADKAQDAADAYLGAVSAGQLAQAQACVLAGTVPESITRSLIVVASHSAVYLPVSAAGSTFVYTGDGKTVTVTVGSYSAGRFWVTSVKVS